MVVIRPFYTTKNETSITSVVCFALTSFRHDSPICCQEVDLQNIFEHRNPEYMTVGFVARCCGVSNTTVLRWIERGQLHAFRLPAGHYRIRREEFDEFLTNYNILASDRQYENEGSRRDLRRGKK